MRRIAAMAFLFGGLIGSAAAQDFKVAFVFARKAERGRMVRPAMIVGKPCQGPGPARH